MSTQGLIEDAKTAARIAKEALADNKNLIECHALMFEALSTIAANKGAICGEMVAQEAILNLVALVTKHDAEKLSRH